MAVLERGCLEHTLLATGPGQCAQLRFAADRVAVERGTAWPRRILPLDAAVCQRTPLHRCHGTSNCCRDRSGKRTNALDAAHRGRHSLAEGAAPLLGARTRL